MAKQNKEQKIADYRLVLVDNKTHKQLWSMTFSKISAFVTGISAVIAVCAFFYCIMAFTPLRTTIPGYPGPHLKRDAVRNAIKADSLAKVVARWEIYSENLLKVINGEAPVRVDSIIKVASRNVTEKSETELRQKDSILRQNVAKEEQFELTRNRRDLPIDGMHFFVPLKGVISQGYDKVVHPYIDITAPENSVVMSVLDGTVIFAGWSDDAGYTIQIQHDNDIISVYKHNRKLLRKTGDKVAAGAPVALVGGTGALSTGEHLHFELWYKGEAIDPTTHINF